MVLNVNTWQAEIRAKSHAGPLREWAWRKGEMEVEINDLSNVPDALCSLFYLILTPTSEISIGFSIERLGHWYAENVGNLLRYAQQEHGGATVGVQFCSLQSLLFIYNKSHASR